MKKVLSILIVLLLAVSVAAEEKGKVSFKPDMRLIFKYDFNMNDNNANAKHLYKLERSYIGLKAKIDNVTFRITGDIKYDTDIDVKGLYLKYAYAEVKNLLPMGKFIFGQQKTGLIDFEGKLWGHRDVAKVPLDRYKWDTSADMGLAYDMKLPNKMGGLHLGYFAGEGYKKDTTEETDQKALSLRANINLGPAMVTAYFKNIWTGTDDTVKMYGAIVSLQNKMISAAAEFFRADDGSAKYQIISAYATFHAMPKKLDIFARFDMADFDIDNDDTFGGDVDDSDANTLFIGLKYFLAKKTSVALTFSSWMPSLSSADKDNRLTLSFDQKF